jgi:RNA polymerase sigma factor (sigma-70 family)
MSAELLHALKNGSDAAFAELFEDVHRQLYHFFLKKLRSSTLAEDLVQETFIKLWRYRASLDPALPLSLQLFRIARTVGIDALRKAARTRVVALPDADLEPLAPLVEFLPESGMMQALSILTPQCRRIIEQRLQGFSNQEISANLSISKKTVENHINKAFQEFRRHPEMPLFLLWLFTRH